MATVRATGNGSNGAGLTLSRGAVPTRRRATFFWPNPGFWRRRRRASSPSSTSQLPWPVPTWWRAAPATSGEAIPARRAGAHVRGGTAATQTCVAATILQRKVALRL